MIRDDTMKLMEQCGYGTLLYHPMMTEQMMRFAALVAAAEREACAKLCKELVLEHPGRADLTAQQCAAAIRARGDK